MRARYEDKTHGRGASLAVSFPCPNLTTDFHSWDCKQKTATPVNLLVFGFAFWPALISTRANMYCAKQLKCYAIVKRRVPRLRKNKIRIDK